MHFELRLCIYLISNVNLDTGFDSGRWDHWLLIICFCGVAFWGLYLSWQWKKENQRKKAHEKLARRLLREVHPLHIWARDFTAMGSTPVQKSGKRP